jgi:hypothetical protein
MQAQPLELLFDGLTLRLLERRGRALTVDVPSSWFLRHWLPPEHSSRPVHEDDQCASRVTDSNELVDGTSTNVAELSDSDRIYLLRSDHYKVVLVAHPVWLTYLVRGQASWHRVSQVLSQSGFSTSP